jgi:hypothetical protein
VIVPLWEWTVARDAQGASAGVCATKHAARDALAKALVASGRPSSGRVAPITLCTPVHREPGYLRGRPELRAAYDGLVIQWS